MPISQSRSLQTLPGARNLSSAGIVLRERAIGDGRKMMAAARRGGSSKGRTGGAVAGQRVVVTAGASGIGRAIADLLLANGAKVAICDVGKDFLAAYRKAHPGSPAVAADVSSEKDVDKLFK